MEEQDRPWMMESCAHRSCVERWVVAQARRWRDGLASHGLPQWVTGRWHCVRPSPGLGDCWRDATFADQTTCLSETGYSVNGSYGPQVERTSIRKGRRCCTAPLAIPTRACSESIEGSLAHALAVVAIAHGLAGLRC